MKQYYICKPGGDQEGPYPEDMVRTCHEQGIFPADTLIWFDGAAEWMPIQNVFAAPQASTPLPEQAFQPQEEAPQITLPPTPQQSTALPPTPAPTPYPAPPAPPQEEPTYYVALPGMQPQGPYTRTSVITGYYQGAYPLGSRVWGPDTGTWIPIENLLGSALHSGVKSAVGHFQGRANAKSWNPITAFVSCMKRYAQFSGRASRSEYWFFKLATVLIVLVPTLIAAVITGDQDICNIVSLIALFPFLLPNLAVQARRLHDRGMKAWWLLLFLLRWFGVIPLLIISCFPSKKEPNQYGSSPLPPA